MWKRRGTMNLLRKKRRMENKKNHHGMNARRCNIKKIRRIL